MDTIVIAAVVVLTVTVDEANRVRGRFGAPVPRQGPLEKIKHQRWTGRLQLTPFLASSDGRVVLREVIGARLNWPPFN